MANAKFSPDGGSVVIVGFWNRRIFTPAWMSGGRLTNQTEIEVEVPVNNPSNPVRFKFDTLTLAVEPERLTITALQNDPDVHQAGADLATKILSELPHTPVSAIGINFPILVDNPGKILLQSFFTDDCNRLADARAKIRATTITRKLDHLDREVNLISTLTEESRVQFIFNFNFNTADAAAAIEYLKSGVKPLRDAAEEILTKVYALTLE